MDLYLFGTLGRPGLKNINDPSSHVSDVMTGGVQAGSGYGASQSLLATSQHSQQSTLEIRVGSGRNRIRIIPHFSCASTPISAALAHPSRAEVAVNLK